MRTLLELNPDSSFWFAMISVSFAIVAFVTFILIFPIP